MTRRKSISGAAAMLAAATLALAACSGTGGDQDATGDHLVFGAISQPVSFDPAIAEWGNRSIYYQSVFDTLLLATPEGEIEPWLATAWSYNEDNTVLTLTIRDDVTFSSGTALDADAVVASMDHFRTGSGPDTGYMTNVDTIEAPDATTVVVTLTQPDPAFLNYLTRTAGLVADPASFESEDLATNPVGSGPYVLDLAETVTGSEYVFDANPDYWNPEVQHWDTVTVRVFTDPTAALNAMSADEVNVFKIATNDNVDFITNAGWTLNTNEIDFQGLLLFDRGGTMNEALGDLRVRQAINYAFDREGLQQALQLGTGSVTTQVFPASSAAYDEALDSYYTYDPDKARELLAEAGYPDGFDLAMPSTTLLGTNTFTFVAQQLGDIGIDVTYTDPGSNFIADMLAPKWPATFMALEQNPDWQLIQFMLSPTATFNPFGFSDPELDALIEQFQFGDQAAQDAAAREINTYMVEQAWFAPFYRVQGVVASNPDITVEMLPSNTLPNIYDIQPAG